eukprot:scaffold49043_cov69-Phaeocystis_antarctica.AAC.2
MQTIAMCGCMQRIRSAHAVHTQRTRSFRLPEHEHCGRVAEDDTTEKEAVRARREENVAAQAHVAHWRHRHATLRRGRRGLALCVEVPTEHDEEALQDEQARGDADVDAVGFDQRVYTLVVGVGFGGRQWRACERNEGLDVKEQTHEVGALFEVS